MIDITRSQFLRLGLAAATFGAGGARAQEGFRMRTRPVPKSGEALPVIGCGTWQTFDVGAAAPERAERAEVLRTLFAAGGRVIDSSPMYGSSEEVVGAALARLDARPSAFLATKVWTSGRAAGLAQMEDSLRLFGADAIDLMQIHNLLDWRTHMPTLRAWKADGKIRYLGVTHYHAGAYDDLAAVIRAEDPDFVQFNYALDDREAERMLLPLAADRGVAVLINRPFGGGGLLRRLMRRPLPEWAAEIGAESWAQALLKFVLAHPAVTCAIPGTGSARHMADNARAGDGRYPDAELRKRMIAEVER